MTFRQPQRASRKCFGDSQKRRKDFNQTVQERRVTELDLFEDGRRTLDVIDTASIQKVLLDDC